MDQAGVPSRPWLRWLTDPLTDVEPQVRGVLFRELLTSEGAVLAGALNGLLISVVRLILHFEPLFVAFAVLQVAVSGTRAWAVARIARRAPPGGGVPTADCGEARVGVSVGYACAPEDAANLAELHRKADAALYASKAAGKGVHRRFAPQLAAA